MVTHAGRTEKKKGTCKKTACQGRGPPELTEKVSLSDPGKENGTNAQKACPKMERKEERHCFTNIKGAN